MLSGAFSFLRGACRRQGANTHCRVAFGRSVPLNGASGLRVVSSVVERLVYTEDVGSSTLSPPTILACAPPPANPARRFRFEVFLLSSTIFYLALDFASLNRSDGAANNRRAAVAASVWVRELSLFTALIPPSRHAGGPQVPTACPPRLRCAFRPSDAGNRPDCASSAAWRPESPSI